MGGGSNQQLKGIVTKFWEIYDILRNISSDKLTVSLLSYVQDVHKK